MVAIVVGVLIALGAEQVVEAARWKRQADHAIETLKGEMASHYFAGSEAMISAPCIDRQLELLEQRLTQPGAYVPAPIYTEPAEDYTFRAPDRVWSDDVWRGVVSEGVSSHLDGDLRLSLSAYYSQLEIARDTNRATQLLVYRLRTLGRPLQLDSASRAGLVEQVEETRGRFKEAALISSQLMRRTEALHLQPPQQGIAEGLAQSGTIKFCRAHRLPLGNDKAVL